MHNKHTELQDTQYKNKLNSNTAFSQGTSQGAKEISFALLCERLDELMAAKSHVALALDGRCGAGKSTLAEALRKKYTSNVIHMDDFFLPPALRTPERFSSPGNNVHYERFLEEISPLITNQESGSYRIFSCKTGEYTTTSLECLPLTIVEGCYSMRPELRFLYDTTVFLDVEKEEQQKRLLHRVGAEALKTFQTRWIPLEESYFSFYDIQGVCDYTTRLTAKMLL